MKNTDKSNKESLFTSSENYTEFANHLEAECSKLLEPLVEKYYNEYNYKMRDIEYIVKESVSCICLEHLLKIAHNA